MKYADEIEAIEKLRALGAVSVKVGVVEVLFAVSDPLEVTDNGKNGEMEEPALGTKVPFKGHSWSDHEPTIVTSHPLEGDEAKQALLRRLADEMP